jgi:hypothetical protein
VKRVIKLKPEDCTVERLLGGGIQIRFTKPLVVKAEDELVFEVDPSCVAKREN